MYAIALYSQDEIKYTENYSLNKPNAKKGLWYRTK